MKTPGPISAVPAQLASYSPAHSDEFKNIELTPELTLKLLDPRIWAPILGTYAGTMRMAVGLANASGNLVGECHNPQPLWLMAREAGAKTVGCPFCLLPAVRCTAVAEAMEKGRAAITRDLTGLAHIAVPLILGGHRLGALLAGQVFDRYPEPLPLQRMARELGASAQDLWRQANRQSPISRNTLAVYGDLLMALGEAFLGQRYAAVLDYKLAESNDRYQFLINSVEDYAFYTVNPDGFVTGWNHGAEMLFGYSDGGIVGHDFSCLFPQAEIDAGLPAETLRRAKRDGRAEHEGWHTRRDGARFYGVSGFTLLKYGGVQEIIVVVHDITERRQAAQELLEAQKLEDMAILERTVTDRTHELANSNDDLRRANYELQQFAHSASHDLQEPPRNVAMYSELFKRRYEGTLDSQADEFLGYMAGGARRMQMLVRDLLAYTQATADEHPPTNVDADLILSDTLANLEAIVKESKAIVTAGKLPTIRMHAVHLRQLFQNLIGNAIKFRKPGCVPTVKVSAERGDREWVFSVSDNGIGMESRHAKRIFGIFKRLHAADEYPGTGIGLAICQKIIDCYRGRIWVESTPQEGAAFFFALPDQTTAEPDSTS